MGTAHGVQCIVGNKEDSVEVIKPPHNLLHNLKPSRAFCCCCCCFVLLSLHRCDGQRDTACSWFQWFYQDLPIEILIALSHEQGDLFIKGNNFIIYFPTKLTPNFA